MNKEAAGGRKSFELMGGTQDQEAYAFAKSCIWRTVSFQALPKKVLCLRNFLIAMGVISLGIDAFDSYLYARVYQYYGQASMLKKGALQYAMDNNLTMTMATKDDYVWTTTTCDPANEMMPCTNAETMEYIYNYTGSNEFSLFNYTDIYSTPPMMATTWKLPKTD